MTTRRDFLKACAAAGAFAPLAGLGRLAFAAEGAPTPLLVVVFQRGGCDGLNLVAPVNDKPYIDARTPDLRVLDSGERPGLALANGLGSGLDFRLHPEARPLFELYEAGRLAVLHACGLMNGTRSHFEAQDLIERGVVNIADYARSDGEVNAHELGNWMLLAAIDAVHNDQLMLADYHFRWFGTTVRT